MKGVNSYYSRWIQPKAPAVQKLLASLGIDEPSCRSKEVFLHALIRHFRVFRYKGEPGFASFDTILTEQTGNCLSLSCFLCSAMRATQWSAEEVFVLVGGNQPKSIHLCKGEVAAPIRRHAWVFIRSSTGVPFLIDPSSMQITYLEWYCWVLESSLVNELWVLLFNDQRSQFMMLSKSGLNTLIKHYSLRGSVGNQGSDPTVISDYVSSIGVR